MIENMRKYTGLMVVVLVLLAAGLILTMRSGNNAGLASGGSVAINGGSIDSKQFKKLGANSLRVISLASSDQEKLYQRYTGILSSPLSRWAGNLGASRYFFQNEISGEELTDFVSKRLLIKFEAEKLGIYPSKERAAEYLKTSIFTTPEGKFDQSRYNQFMKDIGSTGFSEDDVLQLIGEVQVFSKLYAVITSGIESNRAFAQDSALFAQQTINLTAIDLDINTYKKSIKPTEDQIKKFWEEHKGNYRTARQLKVSYVYKTPKYPTPKPTFPARKEGISDADFKKLIADYNEKMKKWEAMKKPIDLKLATEIDSLSYLFDNDSSDFVKRITEEGYKVITTDFFTAESAPAELKAIKTEDKINMVDHLMGLKLGDTPDYQIKTPIRTDNDGWFYVRLDEEKAPTPKTFEAAREQATKDYIKQEAYKAMEAAAPKIKQELSTAIKSGKSPEQAAKLKNLSAKTIPALKAPQRGERDKRAAALFQYASTTDPHSFSKDDYKTDNKITLIYVNKRFVIDTPEAKIARENAPQQETNYLRNQVFQAWLEKAFNSANSAADE